MNTFGRIFRVSIFGESHGESVGVVIDGATAGIPLCTDDFSDYIERRRGGTPGTTQRIESDAANIMSGVFNGNTTGSPICITFNNRDIKSSDYDFVRHTPRPSHGDMVMCQKFHNFNDYRGGGHCSGRLTVAIVAAGVVARKVINNIDVTAKLVEVGGQKDPSKFDDAVRVATADGDSVGGVVECRISGVKAGLGEPFWDSVESLISHAMFSIPAVKGIEFGAGFQAARMFGSQHNDAIISVSGDTKTNNAGGICAGITSGNDIVFRVAVKPTASISRQQHTMNIDSGKIEPLTIPGRHDSCIALRMPVIVESMAAIVIADLQLLNSQAQSK